MLKYFAVGEIMGRLTNSKKIKLLKVERARAILSQEIKVGLITADDILSLISKDINYGLRKRNEKLSYKEAVLKNVFNCPFLLCDQDNLDISIKKLLPNFLSVRYNTEKDILKYYFDNCFLSLEEYNKELDELEFLFYKSTFDGKSILKTGCAVGIKSNIIK